MQLGQIKPAGFTDDQIDAVTQNPSTVGISDDEIDSIAPPLPSVDVAATSIQSPQTAITDDMIDAIAPTPAMPPVAPLPLGATAPAVSAVDSLANISKGVGDLGLPQAIPGTTYDPTLTMVDVPALSAPEDPAIAQARLNATAMPYEGETRLVGEPDYNIRGYYDRAGGRPIQQMMPDERASHVEIKPKSGVFHHLQHGRRFFYKVGDAYVSPAGIGLAEVSVPAAEFERPLPASFRPDNMAPRAFGETLTRGNTPKEIVVPNAVAPQDNLRDEKSFGKNEGRLRRILATNEVYRATDREGFFGLPEDKQLSVVNQYRAKYGLKPISAAELPKMKSLSATAAEKWRVSGDMGTEAGSEGLFRRVPFVRFLGDYIDYNKLKEIESRIDKNGGKVTESDMDYILSQMEKAQQFGTVLSDAVSLASDAPGTGIEMLTGNAVLGGSGTAAKTVGGAVKQALVQGAKYTATVGLPQVTASTLRNMQPQLGVDIEDGELRGVVESRGDAIGTAIVKGAIDSFIENSSEFSGEAINIAGKKLMNRVVSERLRNVSGRLANDLATKVGGKKAAELLTKLSSSDSLARKLAYDGILGEMGEEQVGRLARYALTKASDATGVEQIDMDVDSPLPTMRELVAQAAGFGVYGAGVHTASALTREKVDTTRNTGGVKAEVRRTPQFPTIQPTQTAETPTQATVETTQPPRGDAPVTVAPPSTETIIEIARRNPDATPAQVEEIAKAKTAEATKQVDETVTSTPQTAQNVTEVAPSVAQTVEQSATPPAVAAPTPVTPSVAAAQPQAPQSERVALRKELERRKIRFLRDATTEEMRQLIAKDDESKLSDTDKSEREYADNGRNVADNLNSDDLVVKDIDRATAYWTNVVESFGRKLQRGEISEEAFNSIVTERDAVKIRLRSITQEAESVGLNYDNIRGMTVRQANALIAATRKAKKPPVAQPAPQTAAMVAPATANTIEDFYASSTPQEAGIYRKALNTSMEWRQGDGSKLMGTMASHIEAEVKNGARVALMASGPALVHKDGRGWDKKDIGAAGMAYANWLTSQSQSNPQVSPPAVATETRYTKKALTEMPFPQLAGIAKSMGIKQKGSRESIVKQIMATRKSEAAQKAAKTRKDRGIEAFKTDRYERGETKAAKWTPEWAAAQIRRAYAEEVTPDYENLALPPDALDGMSKEERDVLEPFVDEDAFGEVTKDMDGTRVARLIQTNIETILDTRSKEARTQQAIEWGMGHSDPAIRFTAWYASTASKGKKEFVSVAGENAEALLGKVFTINGEKFRIEIDNETGIVNLIDTGVEFPFADAIQKNGEIPIDAGSVKADADGDMVADDEEGNNTDESDLPDVDAEFPSLVEEETDDTAARSAGARPSQDVPSVSEGESKDSVVAAGGESNSSKPKEAKRSRSGEPIYFGKPIVGPSGASLTSYEWQWMPYEYVDDRGEERVKKVSNWDEAQANDDTGRDVVHQFSVRTADGESKLMSLESALKELGHLKPDDQKGVRSLASSVKTMARLQMELAQASQSLKEHRDANPDKFVMPPLLEWGERRIGKGTVQYGWKGRTNHRDIVLFDDPTTSTVRPERPSESTIEHMYTSFRISHSDDIDANNKERLLSNKVIDLKRRIAKQQKKIDAAADAARQDSATNAEPEVTQDLTGGQRTITGDDGSGGTGSQGSMFGRGVVAAPPTQTVQPEPVVSDDVETASMFGPAAKMTVDGDTATIAREGDRPLVLTIGDRVTVDFGTTKDNGEVLAFNAENGQVKVKIDGSDVDGGQWVNGDAVGREVKRAPKTGNLLAQTETDDAAETRKTLIAELSTAEERQKANEANLYQATSRRYSSDDIARRQRIVDNERKHIELLNKEIAKLLPALRGLDKNISAMTDEELRKYRWEVSDRIETNGEKFFPAKREGKDVGTPLAELQVERNALHAVQREIELEESMRQYGITKADIAAAKNYNTGDSYSGEPSHAFVYGVASWRRGEKKVKPLPFMEQIHMRLAREGFKRVSEGASDIDRANRGKGNADYLRDETDQRIADKFSDTKSGDMFGPDSPIKSASFVAWHGGPHDFDQFSTGKIGTGEGAQAYGWGLYFTSKKDIAIHYRDGLSKGSIREQFASAVNFLKGRNVSEVDGSRLKDTSPDSYSDPDAVFNEAKKLGWKPTDNKGRLYNVELAPNDDELLDWDKPLSQQSEKVKKALSEAYAERGMPLGEDGLPSYFQRNPDGENIYVSLAGAKTQEYASKLLKKYGIRGIRYLDGSSRTQGDGSYNYVIFDDADVRVLNKYSKSQRRGDPMTTDAVNAAVAKMKLGGRKINVVESDFDLPDDVFDAIRRNNALGRVRGLITKDGRVFVIADAVTSEAEVAEVVAHELFHAGEDTLTQTEKALVRKYMTANHPDVVARVKRDYDAKDFDKELLAHAADLYADTAVKPTWYKNLMNMVARAWNRLTGKRFTSADVERIVRDTVAKGIANAPESRQDAAMNKRNENTFDKNAGPFVVEWSTRSNGRDNESFDNYDDAVDFARGKKRADFVDIYDANGNPDAGNFIVGDEKPSKKETQSRDVTDDPMTGEKSGTFIVEWGTRSLGNDRRQFTTLRDARDFADSIEDADFVTVTDAAGKEVDTSNVSMNVKPGETVEVAGVQRPTTNADGDFYFDDSVLQDSKGEKYKSREKLVYMTPDEFLSMAEKIPSPTPSKQDTVTKVLSSGKKFNSIPHLSFEHDGKGVATVVNHEGRHRAMALRDAGVKYMPVVLSSRSGDGDAIRWDQQDDAGNFDRIRGQWPKVLRGQSGGEIQFPIQDPLVPDDTITVDGKSRPTTNSDGKPIHPTREGVENFWRNAKNPLLDKQGRPVVVRHGSDETRYVFDSGTFVTDSLKDASAYAELKRLQREVDTNDALGEIVSEIMSDEGAESITDLGPQKIRDIADANGIDLSDGNMDGSVQDLYLDSRKSLDLTELGSDVGDVSETWDYLHKRGLVDDAWSSMDEEVQYEIEQDFKDKALYSLLEREGAFQKAFDAGYDTVAFVDISPDGGSTHKSWIIKDSSQLKSATGNTGAFDAGDADIRMSKVASEPLGDMSAGGLSKKKADLLTKHPRIAIDPIPAASATAPKQMVINMGDILGKTIRTGKTNRNVLGVYKPATGDTVIRRPNDADTAAHEISHALDDTYGIVAQWNKPRAKSPYDAELEKFWWHGSSTTSGPRARLSYRRAEGVAEFVRAYMVNPDAAKTAAPTFAAFFESKVPQDVRDRLMEAGNVVRQWAGSSATEKTKANIEFEPPQPAGVVQAVKEAIVGKGGEFEITTWDKFKSAMTDRLTPMIKAIRTAKMFHGIENMLPQDNPELLARNYAGINDKIEDIVERGMVDARGRRETAGFKHIFDGLDSSSKDAFDNDYKDMVALAVSQRTLERAEVLDKRSFKLVERQIQNRMEMNQKTIDNPASTQAEVAAAVADNATLQTALDAAVAVGGKFQDKLNEIVKALPGTDFAKMASNAIAQNNAKKANLSGAGALVERDDTVATNTITELQKNSPRFTRLEKSAAAYRQWADALLRYYRDKGRISTEQYDAIVEDNQQYIDFGRVMDEIGQTTVKRSNKHLGTVSDPLKKFKGSVRTMENPVVSLLKDTYEMVREADRNEVMLSFIKLLTNNRSMYDGKPQAFADIGRVVKAGEPNSIRVFRKGEMEYWQFPKEIYESLKGISEDDFGIWMKIGTFLPQLMKNAITHAPDFMIRNTIRDSFTRAIISDHGSKPWDVFKGMSKDELSAFKLAGGGQAGVYMTDRQSYHKAVKTFAREIRKEGSVLLWPHNIAKAYGNLAKDSELLGRISEFRRAKEHAIKKLGYDEYNANLYAANAARDLLDFARAGSVMKTVNRFVPFTNAALQGLLRSGRAAKEHPARFAIRLAAVTLPLSLIAALWNMRDDEDEKEYWQLPAYRRDMFYNFKMGNTWLAIPKPFELGVFSSGVERLIAKARGNDNAFEGYIGSVVKSVFPFDEGAIAGPFAIELQAIANRNFFHDRYIVPPFEADLDLELRGGTKHASRLGQIAQSIFNIDARKADFIIQQQFGGFGKIATDLSNMGREDKSPTDALMRTSGVVRRNSATVFQDVEKVLETAKLRGELSNPLVQELKAKLKASQDDPTNADKIKDVREYAAEARKMMDFDNNIDKKTSDAAASRFRQETGDDGDRIKRNVAMFRVTKAAEAGNKNEIKAAVDEFVKNGGKMAVVLPRLLKEHPYDGIPLEDRETYIAGLSEKERQANARRLERYEKIHDSVVAALPFRFKYYFQESELERRSSAAVRAKRKAMEGKPDVMKQWEAWFDKYGSGYGLTADEKARLKQLRKYNEFQRKKYAD